MRPLRGKFFSTLLAIDSRDASFEAQPINCIPIGRPEEVRPQGMEMAGNPARLDGSSWDDKRIHVCFYHSSVELVEEGFTLFQRLKICCGGDANADFEPRTNIFAVVGGMAREPVHFLMIASGFRPGDIVSGGFRMVEKRDGDFLHREAAFAEES